MTQNRGIRIGFAALAVAALAAGACGDDDKNTKTTTPTSAAGDEPSVTITSPASGITVKGNTVSLEIDVKGVSIVKADGDTSGETAHLHAFIDRAPVAVGEAINKEPGIVHSVDNPLVLTGLTAGEHEITVVLGDGTHARLGETEDSIKVKVDGPTLDATAPTTVAVGSPVRIDFKVAGVSIVKADADTSGKTGHFHVFVDKPLPKPGDVIEKPADGSIVHTADSFVEIPNLAAGEHTFFVVLGDGNHVAFNPLVADKVTVTVQ